MSSFDVNQDNSQEKFLKPKPQKKITPSSSIRSEFNTMESGSRQLISIKKLKAKLLSNRVSATSDSTTESRVQPWTSPYLTQKYNTAGVKNENENPFFIDDFPAVNYKDLKYLESFSKTKYKPYDIYLKNVSKTASDNLRNQSEIRFDKKGKQMLTTLDDFPPILGDCLGSVIIPQVIDNPDKDVQKILSSYGPDNDETKINKLRDFSSYKPKPSHENKPQASTENVRQSMLKQLYEGATEVLNMTQSEAPEHQESIDKNILKKSENWDTPRSEKSKILKKKSITNLETVVTNFDYLSKPELDNDKNKAIQIPQASSYILSTARVYPSCCEISASKVIEDISTRDIISSNPLEHPLISQLQFKSYTKEINDDKSSSLECTRESIPESKNKILKDTCDITTCDKFAKAFGLKKRRFCCENGLCPINDPTTSTYKFLLATKICCNTRGCQLAAKICDIYEPLVNADLDVELDGEQKYHYLASDIGINDAQITNQEKPNENNPDLSYLIESVRDSIEEQDKEEKIEVKQVSTENIKEIVNPMDQDLSEIINFEGARRRTSTVSWIEPTDIAAVHSKSQEEVISRATAEADKFRQTPAAIRHGSVFGDIMRKKLEEQSSVVVVEHEPTIVKSQLNSNIIDESLKEKPKCCPSFREKFKKKKPLISGSSHSSNEINRKQFRNVSTEKDLSDRLTYSERRKHHHKKHKKHRKDRQIQAEEQTQQIQLSWLLRVLLGGDT
ncbi:uncharacterized protein LOC126743543 isoform X2 [Anthonomus grandis grandis]|uniref:uncharacterized protein LOC126743543 isoform X2 n=1 Tax=Anthonomus grandis grandis TaxID=2921223 RepID=UPI002165C2AC|nr:uncharacterized protein LOC126743543 isoform X2 [Anthonomus grandis grandis]